ncbi:hypothetical protein PFISCL1PPCAC_7590, partial [Pristionchus fissidentatus]
YFSDDCDNTEKCLVPDPSSSSQFTCDNLSTLQMKTYESERWRIIDELHCKEKRFRATQTALELNEVPFQFRCKKKHCNVNTALPITSCASKEDQCENPKIVNSTLQCAKAEYSLEFRTSSTSSLYHHSKLLA